MAPLVESVTEKMRVINDLTFQPETPRRTQGGVNRDKVTGDIPRRPCGEVFLCLLKEIVRLQVNTSNDGTLLVKVGVVSQMPLGRRSSVSRANSSGFFFFFFSFISLIADGPHHYHPACGHKGSSHLSPVHALQFFYRDASSALLQLVNQWLNFTMCT